MIFHNQMHQRMITVVKNSTEPLLERSDFLYQIHVYCPNVYYCVVFFLSLSLPVLQLFVLSPGINKEAEMEGTPLCTLLRDPYIIIAAGEFHLSIKHIFFFARFS